MANPERALGGTTQSSNIPTTEAIRHASQQVFGLRPCQWQVEFAQALLKGDSDIMMQVGTGMGKTLAFWLPLLFRRSSILFVVTALNILGQQNVDQLKAAGICAISINHETAKPSNFQVSIYVLSNNASIY